MKKSKAKTKPPLRSKSKTKTPTRKNNSRTSRLKNSFASFQKIVESKIGKVNWKKVGVYTFALLLFVATKGLLGFKAQIIALQIVRYAAYA